MKHASQYMLVMGAVNLVGPGATYSWLGCQQHTHYGPSLDSGVVDLCCHMLFERNLWYYVWLAVLFC